MDLKRVLELRLKLEGRKKPKTKTKNHTTTKNSPSFGLTAAGRLLQSRVQVGQGWGENITSMPFS